MVHYEHFSRLPYFVRFGGLVNLLPRPGFNITRVTRCRHGEKDCLRVEFEHYKVGQGGASLTAGSLVVAPSDAWALQQYEVFYRMPGVKEVVVFRGSLRYGARDNRGVPRLESAVQTTRVAGRTYAVTAEVRELEFSPTMGGEFDLLTAAAAPPESILAKVTRWLLRAAKADAAVLLLIVGFRWRRPVGSVTAATARTAALVPGSGRSYTSST